MVCKSTRHFARWLEELGMSEYAQRFAENDIDFEVLGDLTDADFDRLACQSGIAGSS
jgi:SAM domain (Sterile alpha motif)